MRYMAEQQITYHFKKLIKTINSCETDEHLQAAKKMISYFVNYWKYKLSADIIRHYLRYLNILFNYKKSSILNYE
jgi:hypothetical protein